MANIKDVAKAAGVGIGTVSRALNDSGYVEAGKKEKIIQIAKELGYKPNAIARSFVKNRSNIVGVVLPDVSFPFYGAFLKYAEIELSNMGYHTLVFNTIGVRERVTQAVELLETNVLDGLIINADVTHEDMIRMGRLPVVSFERMLGKEIPMVASDHVKGGKIAAKLFLDNGCKNVMILSARMATHAYAEKRIEECKRILEAKRVNVISAELNASLLSFQLVEEMVSQYLDIYNRADGIFTDDVCAYSCVKQAGKRGLQIPRDMKIVGYDGNDITRMISPQITTIAQDILLLARTSVEVLLDRIEGKSVNENYFVPVRLQRGGTINTIEI